MKPPRLMRRLHLMKRRQWIPPLSALLLLSGCVGGLDPALRHEIADEQGALKTAERQVSQYDQAVHHDLSTDPGLFRNAHDPARWDASIRHARETLQTAEEVDRELAALSGHNRSSSHDEAERLLTKEKQLRRTAVEEAGAAAGSAEKWVRFKRNLTANMEVSEKSYHALNQADLDPLTQVVEHAGRDWPEKKATLDARLAAIRDVPGSAEALWNATATARARAVAGTIGDGELATLIEENEALERGPAIISAQSDELRALAGQLYNSWDKILVDLDTERERGDPNYRERIKTVRTHFTDLAAKKTETSNSESWVPVSESSFRAVENDLGMAVAHKDAGLFDSEAVNTPQPAGFAYIAPESQGSNQYGYWTHDGGPSVWTWLPQYLILRELLWNHSYHPILVDEYRNYRTAERVGSTYYGRATPAGAPKYGTHGTFTQSSYASSRYVQSGGFARSAYASHRAPGALGEAHAQQRSAPSFADRGAGRRFGSGASPSPLGRRFGGGGKSFGRGFGRRR